MSLLNEVLKDLDGRRQSSPDEVSLQQYSAAAPSAEKRQKLILGAVVALVAVFLVGAVVWFVQRDSGASPTMRAMPQAQTPVVQDNVDIVQEKTAELASVAEVPSPIEPASPVVDPVAQDAPESEVLATSKGALDKVKSAAATAKRFISEGVDSIRSATQEATAPTKPPPKLEPAAVKPVLLAADKTAIAEVDPSSAITPKPVQVARTPRVRAALPSSSSSRSEGVDQQSGSRTSRPAVAQAPKSYTRGSSRRAESPVLVSPRPRYQNSVQLDLAARERAQQAIKVGDLDQAERGLREFLLDHPHGQFSRDTLAALMLQQNRPVEAEKVLIGGIAMDRDGRDRIKLLARASLARNDVDGALRLLEANDVPLADDPEYHALRAALLQRAGRHGAASRTYRALLAEYPAQPAWWVGLGISLEASGQRKDAIAAYRQARDSQDTSPTLRKYASQRMSYLLR